MADYTSQAISPLTPPFADSDPYDIQVAELDDGGFVVGWVNGPNSNVGNLVAQVFDADGRARSDIIDVPDGGQFYAGSMSYSISALRSGNFVMAWEDNDGTLGDADGIHAQIFSASGIALSDEILVNTNVEGREYDPLITSFSDGSFIVMWASTEGNSISAQKFTNEGAKISAPSELIPERRIVTEVGPGYTTQKASSVNPLSTIVHDDDSYTVVFSYNDINIFTLVTYKSLMAQTFDGSGNSLVPAFPIYTPRGSLTYDIRYVDISAVNGSEFLLGYGVKNFKNGDYDTYIDQYDKFGHHRGELYYSTGGGDQKLVDISENENGRVIAIVFDSVRNASYGSVFNVDIDSKVYYFGEQVGDEFFVLPGWYFYSPSYVSAVISNDEYSFRYVGLSRQRFDGVYDEFIGTGLISSAPGQLELGTSADDILMGAAGDDDLNGAAGSDLLAGMDGDDVLSGDDDDDVLEGGNGRDVLYGGTGDDRLLGGPDKDYLDGGTAGDELEGGPGDDVYIVDDPLDVVAEHADEGWDIVGTYVSYVMADHVDAAVALSDRGLEIAGNREHNEIEGGEGADILSGAIGDDDLGGRGGDDHLLGDDGSDFLSGGDGDDILDGGDGDDILSGRNGADSIDGGEGFDVVFFSERSVLDLEDVSLNEGEAAGDDYRSVEKFIGGFRNDRFSGTASQDIFAGGYGDDHLFGRGGDDELDGGDGIDTAVYAVERRQVTFTRLESGLLAIDAGPDGRDTLSGFERYQFTDGEYSFLFASNPDLLLEDYAVNVGGWTSQDRFPRQIADINGDHRPDIVGFGDDGMLVSFARADGGYQEARLVLSNFGQSSGWSSNDAFHRELADLNGNGTEDVLGFGQAGLYAAVSNREGVFGNVAYVYGDFGRDQGWSSQDRYARTVGDFNGDGKADLIGFGQAGTLVALNYGFEYGTFKPVMLALANFGGDQGWTSDNSFHREVGDVNGDGYDDIVGFGYVGTYVALSNGDGTFETARLVLENFGAAQGWSSQDAFARAVADVNGDGRADIVGFGAGGTFVAYGLEDGTFSAASFDVENFGAAQGWTSDRSFHRTLADIDNDGLNDIVGFGFAGVLAGFNQGDVLM